MEETHSQHTPVLTQEDHSSALSHRLYGIDIYPCRYIKDGYSLWQVTTLVFQITHYSHLAALTHKCNPREPIMVAAMVL